MIASDFSLIVVLEGHALIPNIFYIFVGLLLQSVHLLFQGLVFTFEFVKVSLQLVIKLRLSLGQLKLGCLKGKPLL